jgi:hypothetical protein
MSALPPKEDICSHDSKRSRLIQLSRNFAYIYLQLSWLDHSNDKIRGSKIPPKRCAMTIKSNIVSGRQLRAARVLSGLTQAELSIESGFAQRACRYWENRGDNPPTSIQQSLESIEAVLRHHGVEVFSYPTPGCRLLSSK